jgi:uncharacterized membrane protein HdeD (DUF308 family)
MSFETRPPLTNPWAGDLRELRPAWVLLLVLGIVLIVLGILAISANYVSALLTLLTVYFLGGLVLLAGGVQIAAAFMARRWAGFFLHLLAGALYAVLGFLMIARPGAAAAGLTLLLAILLLASGLVRIISALSHRYHNWGWVLLSGVINLVLGAMIAEDWPEASLWVIGLFVGIDLLFSGWSCVMLALAIRGVTERPA